MRLSEKRKKEARAILKKNDLGNYTVPCHTLYPFQWNWDSVIVALGWATFDEERAWQEIESLLQGQWSNGMVPHIVFHHPSKDYYPGPEHWGVSQNPPTSSISQPPILAEGCLLLWRQAHKQDMAEQKARLLFAKLYDYQLWWFNERSADGVGINGLPLNIHPWESGMDNSPAWDRALAAVPSANITTSRRDLKVVSAAQRPQDQEYKRYMRLVYFFKEAGFIKEKMLQSPYRVHDIGIISLLHRSGEALCLIADELGINSQALRDKQQQLKAAASQLWHKGTFHSYDAALSQIIPVETSSGFLSLYGELATEEQAAQMNAKILRWLAQCRYGLPSIEPSASYFESQRYWRGPVWLHMNWMIAEGLKKYDYQQTAEKLRQTSIELINKSGFAEYYDPLDGTACGGQEFSWPAALALFWLNE